MTLFPLPPGLVEATVSAALKEDLGDAGDVTSNACIPATQQAVAAVVARKPGAISGVEAACAAFRLVDRSISITTIKADGSLVKPGDAVMRVSGGARAILTAERVALNFLGHLSGVATATAALVTAIDGTTARIACTRKTTPGLRAFEKHAVRCGGGVNHRFGLYDAVMIKDNHIAACGGVTQALRDAKAAVGHTVKIEIEVDTLAQLEDVLKEGADIILLDNMNTDDLKRAVIMTNGRAILEASGNVKAETVRAIAETGVDIISSGWITHSAPTLDLGLDFG
ncbi:MAG: carboxylating nicotinate-nucleotide diphosphorylase [Pseudomonadota bacterium]